MPDFDQLRHIVDGLEGQRQAFNAVFEREQEVIAAFDQQRQALDAFDQHRQAIERVGREWLARLAAGEQYLKELGARIRNHEGLPQNRWAEWRTRRSSSDSQRARVLTAVKARRSAPPPLRGAHGLDAGSAHARPGSCLTMTKS